MDIKIHEYHFRGTQEGVELDSPSCLYNHLTVDQELGARESVPSEAARFQGVQMPDSQVRIPSRRDVRLPLLPSLSLSFPLFDYTLPLLSLSK